MITKSFYLLGTDPAVSKNLQSVDIDVTEDLNVVKNRVADCFSILDPKGVGFQISDAESIAELEDILDINGPVALTIDGNAVREVPGPSGFPFVGSHYEVFPDHIGNHLRMFEKYGHVIQYENMGRTVYLTDDPEVTVHIFQETPFWSKFIGPNHPLAPAKDNENGLFLTDTSSTSWRLSHKFLAPALAPKAVRKYTPMMQSCAEDTFKVFDEFAEQREAFDVFKYMGKLTSQSVGKLVLGLDMHHFDTPDAPLHSLVNEIVATTELIRQVGDKGVWYSYLPFGAPKKLRDTKAAFQKHCAEAIAAAQTEGATDLPIATAAIEAKSIADFAGRAVDEDGNKLPMETVLNALPIIIGAGFLTTATLLSWMIYSATHYAGVQDRLLQELIDSGVTSETRWTFDTTNELQYLDKFIKEVQRLYNPAFQPARTAMREQIIPGGYRVPKGTVMVGSLHSLHRNPEVWDDPGRFEPGRWDTEKVKKRPAGAYIPFAMGPRSCPGMNFALQEVKTAFATLLYRYEFVACDDNKVMYNPESLAISPQNLYMQVRQRTKWPHRSMSARS